MKIMYYELIKMLIEYERNKQPEVRNTISKHLYLTTNCSVLLNQYIFVHIYESNTVLICICLATNILLCQAIKCLFFFQQQVWDASKSVGKIEGYQVICLFPFTKKNNFWRKILPSLYIDQFLKIFSLVMQELTNKLQRYLNQRFMLDSDQVENSGDDGDDDGADGGGDAQDGDDDAHGALLR